MIRFKTVLLPPEHGGWSFLLEPIALGLLVAPSWGGLGVALAVAAAFLARQPIRRLLSDVRCGRGSAATGMALVAATAELLVAAAFLVLSLHQSVVHLVPLLLALPVAASQIVFDARNRSRSPAAEVLAPLALGAAAPAIALAGGWAFPDALALWLLVAARDIPTVLYVRERLRGTGGVWPSLAAHLVAVIAAAMLFRRGYAPFLAVVALFALLGRAAVDRGAAPAKVVGMREIAHGATTVLLIALGFRLAL